MSAATTKPNVLCPACIEAIQYRRNRLPSVQEAVRLFIGIKPVSAQQSKVAASGEPQSPLNLAAETLVTDIDEVLSRVGNYLIRDLVAQPAQRFKVWRGDCEQIVYWDGVDLALQIDATYRRAFKLLGLEPQWQRRTAPCRVCGLPCLGQFTGSTTIQCSNCGDQLIDSDYQEYCRNIAKGRNN